MKLSYNKGFVLLALFTAIAPLILHAGARPGSEDAACDEISREWVSNKQNLTDRQLNFYLFDASDVGCITLVEQLLQAGASVDARDRGGNTAFLLSARKGHNAIIELLLDQGSDRHQKNLLGSNALVMAVKYNRRKTVGRLLELGLDFNLVDTKAVSPLIAAAYSGNLRILDMLIEAGADVTIVDDTGKSAIIYAAGRGYLSIVQRLLSHSDKIDANARYGNQLTALMWAAGHGNDVPASEGLKVVEYLLSAGADPGLVDNRGRNALHIAAERGHPLIVAHLLNAGVVANSKDNSGVTPLTLTDNPEVRALLERR